MTALADKLGALTVQDAASAIGVELRGDDGQPFCCGERMNVKGGIVGVDYAKCASCGAFMWRVDSPHTNGGIFLTDEELDALGDRVWVGERP